jgi:hypothetical protein
LNLPATVEMSTPNIHTGQIEWFYRTTKNGSSFIISLQNLTPRVPRCLLPHTSKGDLLDPTPIPAQLRYHPVGVLPMISLRARVRATVILFAGLHFALASPATAELKVKQIPTQNIAALGDAQAACGVNAEDWSFGWLIRPRARWRSLSTPASRHLTKDGWG